MYAQLRDVQQTSPFPKIENHFKHLHFNAHSVLFLEAVASLGLVVSLSQSVCQSAFSKIRKRVFKRKYK